MPIERIIGIDFGTSTSVIRVKRYKDGKPLVDKLNTQAVTFNMGSTMLPTLIRKIENGTYYGYEAQIPKKNSTLYQNFKIKLESDNAEEKAQARELTREFFKYMASVYKEQSAGGHLGESTDVEKTLISYPVKWTDETKKFMLQTAKESGFPNVEGLDEAQSAIHAAIVQNEENLQKNGYLQNGKPVNIMLIDMGAGTTDIVISEYTPGTSATNRVLCTWPKDGDILFGGREVDELLLDYIKERLPEDEAERICKKCSTDAFKEWKDTMVSPGLKRSETIAEFSALDNITEMLDIEVEYAIDRSEFEKTTEAYLQKLPLLVKGSLTEARLKGSDIDLVILTGGHSQWYFVKDILTNTTSKFGACGLDKIKADSNRVISISLPQETVALGLVYDKLAESFSCNTQEDKKESTASNKKKGQKNTTEADADKQNSENARKAIDQYISELRQTMPNITPVLYVSDKFSKPELGVVVTGYVFCDSISVGQQIEWTINDRKVCAEISGIELDRKNWQKAYKYDEVGLLIKNIKSDDIENGCLICVCEKKRSGQSLEQETEKILQNFFTDEYKNDFHGMKWIYAPENAIFESLIDSLEKSLEVEDIGEIFAGYCDGTILGNNSYLIFYTTEGIYYNYTSDHAIAFVDWSEFAHAKLETDYFPGFFCTRMNIFFSKKGLRRYVGFYLEDADTALEELQGLQKKLIDIGL